ncbi:MAG: NAD(+)--dinitrogen-reductase ADP-D-ribosyltransferase [Magnetococcales bacterium]|nr:NAD(+)--dinitrogen-reductase ADP-D-ribosyltransferase [Magnetococcales bacterium]
MRQDKHDCSVDNTGIEAGPWVPPEHSWTRFNRCNVPASVLVRLEFQQLPEPLELDGVAVIHKDLFRRLETLDDPLARSRQFMDYMTVHFSLNRPENAGFDAHARIRRHRADYLSLLRGWLFDAEGREGAVLKGWVASRFGLPPRYFGGRMALESQEYQRFLGMQSIGIYNANNLEGQLDLLYAYCQYELARQRPGLRHVTLYRGVNRLEEHEIVGRIDKKRCVVLLNNLSSFTGNRERADEFGDRILETEVPLVKIFFFNALLPGILKGEEEHLVIGGLYEVTQWC